MQSVIDTVNDDETKVSSTTLPWRLAEMTLRAIIIMKRYQHLTYDQELLVYRVNKDGEINHDLQRTRAFALDLDPTKVKLPENHPIYLSEDARLIVWREVKPAIQDGRNHAPLYGHVEFELTPERLQVSEDIARALITLFKKTIKGYPWL